MKLRVRISLFAIILLSTTLSSCYQSKNLTLATHVKGTPIEKIGKDMAQYLETNGWKIKVLSGNQYNTVNNVQALIDKKVDLAIISNKIRLNKKTHVLRTVIPIYPVVATILCRDSLQEKDFITLLTKYEVGFFREDADFFMHLFAYFGVDTTRLNKQIYPEFSSVEQGISYIDQSGVDLLCLFNVIPSLVVRNFLRNGWAPINMIDSEDQGQGSAIRGFCLTYPSTYPYVIPEYIYGVQQKDPVYTIATDYILAAREDEDNRLIYDLVKDIMQGRSYLTQINPTATHLTENFNRSSLTLPLQEGALNYFDRNKPSFFVRYAEPIGLGLSILMLVAGGLTSLKKLKKERIDKYYKKVSAAQSREELNKLKEKALQQLEKEQLAADEAFSIFLTILEQKLNDLEKQKKEAGPD